MRKRYHILDDIRGVTLVSMICYHGAWDWNYIFGGQWAWFLASAAYWWQQSICWTFILLSGFCWPLGKRKLRRGLTVLGVGFLVSLVTEIAMPGQRIRFGVLTFLGCAMLLLIPLEKVLQKLSSARGLAGSLLCFAAARNINEGYLGFEGLNLIKLPEQLYRCGDLMTFLGFTDTAFYSTDYFSLLPWCFLFGAGYFGCELAEEKHMLYKLTCMSDTYSKLPLLGGLARGFRFLGRHSLMVYLVHQPVVYGVLYLCKYFADGGLQQ